MKQTSSAAVPDPARRIEYLKHWLPKMFLFSELPVETLHELVDQYWDKFDWLNFHQGKARASVDKQVRSVCSLPVNDQLLFVTRGELLIFSEVTADEDEGKTSASLIKILRTGEHFGDEFYSNISSINGVLNIKIETRNRQAEWISINRDDFEDAVKVLNQNLFLKTAYEQKSDDYQDLAFRLQQMKEGNVYQKLRYFITMYSHGNEFDFKLFNQQTIADALRCDRTAINKELKALQKLSTLELGIKFENRVMKYKLLPELSPSLSSCRRFKWFVERHAELISQQHSHHWGSNTIVSGSYGLRFCDNTLKSLASVAAIDTFELIELLEALSSRSEDRYRIQIKEHLGVWQLIYKALPAKIK
ncbi:hypothetical protein [Psychromonas aquimarina]|uniref:hypothetical protein n=1 Tax=Psychromonas aquimarina TaxID=444919 RepID=UPI00040BCED4|nr:hypothetical protein [Psychromonas aquimarina]